MIEHVITKIKVDRFRTPDGQRVCYGSGGIGKCIFWSKIADGCRYLDKENETYKGICGEWVAPVLPGCPVWDEEMEDG